MDFSALSSVPLDNYDPVLQGFGDTSQVDVSYRSLTGDSPFGASAVELSSSLAYWNSPAAYSFDNAVFASSVEAMGEIRVATKIPGQFLTSLTVTFGAFPDLDTGEPLDRNVVFRIFNSTFDAPALLSGFGNTVDGTTGLTVSSLGFTPTSMLILQWGDDVGSEDWNVGVLSISYTLNVPEVNNPVPLPAALPLFVAGLGALGLIGHRRKRKQAIAN